MVELKNFILTRYLISCIYTCDSNLPLAFSFQLPFAVLLMFCKKGKKDLQFNTRSLQLPASRGTTARIHVYGLQKAAMS
jgi:hypothetical protein